MNERPFKVRELRSKGWLWIDDEYMDRYAKIFGPAGAIVYMSLCRRANKEQSCWPSEKNISEQSGITERTVRKYLKLLEGGNLIKIKRERTKSGTWKHSVYYLVDRSEWKPPETISAGYCHRKIKTASEENHDADQRNKIPLKDTQEKGTQNKDSRDKKVYSMIPVSTYQPDTREKAICHEIAKWLDEKDMNFILSRLRQNGLDPIERARGIVKEDARRKSIRNKRSYFNAVLRNIIKGRTETGPLA